MLELKESRLGTDSIKWDDLKQRFGSEDLLPMWVADMDFAVSPAIQHALERRAAHPNYGYTLKSDAYNQAVQRWMKVRHGIGLEKEWIVFTPGVVTAISLLIQAFSREGDKILIQTPVYTPFYDSVRRNNRVLVEAALKLDGESYAIDFKQLEDYFRAGDIKAMIFCNPHNPIGKVWDSEDVKRLVKLCHRYEVYLISDEIHQDLCFDKKHYSVLRTDPTYHDKLAVCTAPSKTFNIAGLHVSNVLIPDAVTREAYKARIDAVDVGGMNPLGQQALIAAYTQSDEWYEALMIALKENLAYLNARLASTAYCVYPVEGTYLCMIDFSAIDDDPARFRQRLIDEAKLAVQMGEIFGSALQHQFRLNFGCSRELLDEGLNRLLSLL